MSSTKIDSILQNLENVPNARDLSSAAPGRVAPGRIYRSGNPAQGTVTDVKILRNDLKISRMVDFRSKIEHQDDTGWNLMLSNGIIKSYDTAGTLTTIEIDVHSDVVDLDLPTCELYRFPLVDKRKYVRTLLGKISWFKAVRVLAYKLVQNEDGMRQVLIPEINRGGIPLFYQVIMESAPDEIYNALIKVTEAVVASKPQIVFCKLGKDRTGLIAALILACCGATDDEIIADYIRSDGAGDEALGDIQSLRDIQGVDRSLFSKPTPEVMETTLKYVREKYGGLKEYMISIGFDEIMQTRLMIALRPETSKSSSSSS